MRLVLLAASAALFAVFAVGCGKPEPTLEERAQGVDRQLICPVCPGETLDQSNVQIAKDMRVVIRERLVQGESEDEIKLYFVERYGTRILAEPPTSGISLVVWIVPPAAMVLGAGALYMVVREMRRRRVGRGGVLAAGTAIAPGAATSVSAPNAAASVTSPGERPPSPDDPTLKPYLDAVDEELRSGQVGRS